MNQIIYRNDIDYFPPDKVNFSAAQIVKPKCFNLDYPNLAYVIQYNIIIYVNL